MMSKGSIIIPLYNAASFIERCLQSIVQQDSRNWEVILVNDGSKDDSGEICDAIAAIYDNVKVLHKPNGGVSSARNLGIENATGEWIAFVDIDDQISPDALMQFEHAVTVNPDADYHTFNIRTTRIDGTVSGFNYSDQVLTTGEVISKSLKYEVCVGPYAKLFRKSIIDRFGLKFDINLRIGEDLIFNIDYLIHSNSKCMMYTSGVYEYLQNENSAMFAHDNTMDYIRLSEALCQYRNNTLFSNADINLCIATNLITNLIRQKKYFDKSLTKQLLDLTPITDNGSYTNMFLGLLRIGRWFANARLAVSYSCHHKI